MTQQNILRFTLSMMALALLIQGTSCKKEEGEPEPEPHSLLTIPFVKAVDISSLPELRDFGTQFYDSLGNEVQILEHLKEQGVNCIRLRLWVNPDYQRSSLGEVKAFAEEIHEMDMGVWLSLHYSDTWADPGQQRPPRAWKDRRFTAIVDSVFEYTRNVVSEIRPEYVQIGNEINSGFLKPYGDIDENPTQFTSLIQSALDGVKVSGVAAQTIIHFAGFEGSEWFFEQVDDLDYDIIGISYYPIWHGTEYETLAEGIDALSEAFDRDIIIAETAYPFTLSWDDQTNNIVGLPEQLIIPEFQASKKGQRDFLAYVRNTIEDDKQGIGFCYWGAELVAFKGSGATDGSPWENQALFDFDNRALRVQDVFND